MENCHNLQLHTYKTFYPSLPSKGDDHGKAGAAWSSVVTLTDMVPENCQRFIDCGGLEAFMAGKWDDDVRSAKSYCQALS